MAAGIQYNKQALDNIAGGLSQQFKQLMEKSHDFDGWLTKQPDAYLISLGYTTTDITILRGAASDMATLTNVALGVGLVTTTYNFTLNTAQLWGVGF